MTFSIVRGTAPRLIYPSLQAPFLGATPDGLWHCSCHGVGLLEVKCPWSLREPHHKALEAPFLTAAGRLSEQHTYYTQIQTQLHVCRKETCHLIVWLPHQFAVIEVRYSPTFFKPLLQKGRQVWLKHVLPALFWADTGKGTWPLSDYDSLCQSKGTLHPKVSVLVLSAVCLLWFFMTAVAPVMCHVSYSYLMLFPGCVYASDCCVVHQFTLLDDFWAEEIDVRHRSWSKNSSKRN